MKYKFFWGDGKVSLTPITSGLHHIDLWMRDHGDNPVDSYIAGYYNDDTREVTPTWGQGPRPLGKQLQYVIEQELGRFDKPSLVDRILRRAMAATVEDTEPPYNFGFLSEPHKNLYPAAFDGDKMRFDAVKKIKNYVLAAIETGAEAHADSWIYFTVYGSGASYNWDETGDFDVQMWVDIDLYNDHHQDQPLTSDELLDMVRRAVQTVNFPSFKQLGLDTPDCEGLMLIQYYAKPGKGTEEENLASKPYACYDMETNEWLQQPEPFTPEFYGESFLRVMPKAADIADQSDQLLAQFNRNIINWQFWTQLYQEHKNDEYKKQADASKTNAQLEQQGIMTLFQGVFGGRQQAYSEEGEGYKDERDLVQKLLEVWGIFQNLKHFARLTLPWDEQEMPEDNTPKNKDSATKLAIKFEPDINYYKEQGLPVGGCFGYIGNQLLIGTKHHQQIMGKLLDAGWDWEDLFTAPQAWGWFGVQDYDYATSSYDPYLSVQFSSDAGVQDEGAMGRAKAKLVELYHLPVRQDQYIKGKERDEDYGKGLRGQDFIQNYEEGGSHHHLLKKIIGEIPPPPPKAEDGGNTTPVEEPTQVPGPGFPPPQAPAPTGSWSEEIELKALDIINASIELPIESQKAAVEAYLNTTKLVPKNKAALLEYLFGSKTSALQKFADWNDIMDKSRRLMQNGQVQIQVNAPDHVVGQVQGDHDTYQTEIWRDDPQSQAITMWDCGCQWSDFSWGRTRQFKKYEGRPCSHTLALFWQAQKTPLTKNTPDGQGEPQPLPGGEMAPAAQPTPGLIQPYDPSPLIEPFGSPHPQGPPMPLQSQPEPYDPMQTLPTSPMQEPSPTPVTPSSPTQSQPTVPGKTDSPLAIPGALSKVAAFANGQIVRCKVPLQGEEPTTGQAMMVPQNTAGEVLYSDGEESVVIFPLKGGALTPHLIKVECMTDELYADPKGQPFIKKKHHSMWREADYGDDDFDPQAFQNWIAEHGPLFYHLDRSRPGGYLGDSPPGTDNVPSILQNGLVPGKAGHVFLGSESMFGQSEWNEDVWQSHPQYMVDVRSLDPSKITEFHLNGHIQSDGSSKPFAIIRYDGIIPPQAVMLNPQEKHRTVAAWTGEEAWPFLYDPETGDIEFGSSVKNMTLSRCITKLLLKRKKKWNIGAIKSNGVDSIQMEQLKSILAETTH
jgi:hypothetical protein